MNKIFITNPPLNCWANGYPVRKGITDSSLNLTGLHTNKNNILPDQKRLRSSFEALKSTLTLVGYEVITLDFPNELDTDDGSMHDGVFVRDVGMMYKECWIKSNFSATERQPQAEAYAKLAAEHFGKKVINMPVGTYLEFGETYYIEASNGKYYFGGISRANREGHDFVKKILQPDHYLLIKSNGYHLDTVFSPVVSKNNELIALIVAKDMIDRTSFENLKKLNIELILINNQDSCDNDGLGNYAVNALTGNGFLIHGTKFVTPQVEDKLSKMGIELYVVPVEDYAYCGGSIHCMTNEIIE